MSAADQPGDALRRALTAFLLVAGVVLAPLPVLFPLATASADPDDSGPSDQADPDSADNSAAVTACSTMTAAMTYAAANYSDFADDMSVSKGDYSDPSAAYSSKVGQSALQQAADAARQAADVPGLQPEIATPIRAWSTDATKLTIMMGVHVGQDSVNGKANDLNTDAQNVKMACAAAGTTA